MKGYSITRPAHKLDIYVFYSDDKDKITKYDLTVRAIFMQYNLKYHLNLIVFSCK